MEAGLEVSTREVTPFPGTSTRRAYPDVYHEIPSRPAPELKRETNLPPKFLFSFFLFSLL